MGKDPVETPDLMRWQIWDVGTRTGSMQNALSVPNAASVRDDMTSDKMWLMPKVQPNSRHAVTAPWHRSGGGGKRGACLHLEIAPIATAD